MRSWCILVKRGDAAQTAGGFGEAMGIARDLGRREFVLTGGPLHKCRRTRLDTIANGVEKGSPVGAESLSPGSRSAPWGELRRGPACRIAPILPNPNSFFLPGYRVMPYFFILLYSVTRLMPSALAVLVRL